MRESETTVTNPTTFLALLDKRPAASPALGGAGRRDATSGELAALARRTVATLNGLGIGRGDRVALVLPNGPEMAAAFLAIGAGATTCPLNPAYRAEEYRFYLDDLKAKAIVLPADATLLPLARQVAGELGLLVLALAPQPDFAGAFALAVDAPGKMALSLRQGGPAEPSDVALILHTSGTTSRPKIVPLTQENLLASAHNIAGTLRLSAEDRCLNIMPLFHIHGLIGATLSTMAGGGSLYATPGFNALRFMAELAEAQAHLVLGRAHHAPGDPRARRAAARGGQGREAALRPLVVVVAAAAGDGGRRGALRLPGDRELRHDRGQPPDDLEPAAAGPAQARLGRPRRRPARSRCCWAPAG